MQKGSNNVIFHKHSRGSDIAYFSLDDARECLKKIKESAAQESNEETISKKEDVLTRQVTETPQQKVGAASIADILGFNPAAIKAKNTTRDKDPGEVPVQYRKYYKLLLKLKENVKNGLSKLTNTNLAISVGAKKNEADPDVAGFDSEFAISLMSNEQEALTEIEEAIRRIHNGTYGICEITGKPIEPERLLAVPFARYSLEGQKEQEKNKKSEIKQQQGAVFHDENDTDFEEEAG